MNTHIIRLAPMLLPLLSQVAHAETTCTQKGQSAFFATYGDNTQRDDGAGTVDDPAAALYNMPPALMANAAAWWGNGIARADQSLIDSAHIGVLQGYTPFDYEDTQSAFIRFDLYFTQYSNTEGFLAIEESGFTGGQVNFAYYDRLRSKLREYSNDENQWVSIRLDLITGNAYAWEIDAYGNPVFDYGQFAVFGEDPWDYGQLYYWLKMASDGDLYVMLYDDMALGYVAIYGTTTGEGDCYCK